MLGDRKGGVTTERIGRDFAILDRLLELFEEQLKFIHVVRNPFDVIATMSRKSPGDLSDAAERFFAMVRTNDSIRSRLGAEKVLDIRHEDLVDAPIEQIARIIKFLDVEETENYFGACAGIIARRTSASRTSVQWPPNLVGKVTDACNRFVFLSDYGYES